MAMQTWKVKMLQGGKARDVTIVLGVKSDKIDVFNALRRRGIGGEVLKIQKV